MKALILSAVLLVSTVGAAGQTKSLMELPVEGSKLVPLEAYVEATALAARGNDAPDIALNIVSHPEISSQ